MNLRERREKLSLSQEELARITGISTRTVQRHEAGLSQSPAVKTLLNRELDRMEKKIFRLVSHAKKKQRAQ